MTSCPEGFTRVLSGAPGICSLSLTFTKGDNDGHTPRNLDQRAPLLQKTADCIKPWGKKYLTSQLSISKTSRRDPISSKVQIKDLGSRASFHTGTRFLSLCSVRISKNRRKTLTQQCPVNFLLIFSIFLSKINLMNSILKRRFVHKQHD